MPSDTLVNPDDMTACSCPGPERLGAFLDDRLSDDDRPPVEEHLARCDACRWVAASTVELSSTRRHVVRRAPIR